MVHRFGFVPSDHLKSLIDDAFVRVQTDQGRPLYEYRNTLIKQVGHELIDNLLIRHVKNIDGSRAKQILKLGYFLQQLVDKIIHVMITKDDDDVVMQSFEYLQQSLSYDTHGNLRLGFILGDQDYANIVNDFNRVAAAVDESQLPYEAVIFDIKRMTKLLLQYFLIDFVATLNWGLVKRKLVQGTSKSIDRAVSVLVERLVPKLSVAEMQYLAPTVNHYFFEEKPPKS